jgi:hypothetical protein
MHILFYNWISRLKGHRRCFGQMMGWGLAALLLLHALLCLANGVYSGRTSSYVRGEFPSTDIPLESEWFATPNGFNAPQQVWNFVA